MENNLTYQSEVSLLTVVQFSKKHGWAAGGLRHLIFHKPNGFARVIKRVGRKVLLDEQAFFAWVEEINNNNKQ